MSLTLEGVEVALGGRPVLRGIDAKLAPGALIGVLGPNGAGKSTLARALLGLVPLARGQVRIDGEDIRALKPAGVARRIAYLPQGHALHWPLSVERLVSLGRLPHLAPLSRLSGPDREAIEQAMALTGTRPLRHRDATELSGGERARVMLARALAVGAPVLIADEPLAALDPGHQMEVMALLGRLAGEGRLVLVVLHDLTMAARHCARLLLLHEGRLMADGPPEQVLTDEALARVYGVRAWRGEVAGTPLLVPLPGS